MTHFLKQMVPLQEATALGDVHISQTRGPTKWRSNQFNIVNLPGSSHLLVFCMISCKQLKAFVCFQRHPSSELQLNPLVFQRLEVKPMNRMSNSEVQDEVVLISTPTNHCHFILLNKNVTSVPFVLFASDSYVTQTRLYGKIATFFLSPPKLP